MPSLCKQDKNYTFLVNIYLWFGSFSDGHIHCDIADLNIS